MIQLPDRTLLRAGILFLAAIPALAQAPDPNTVPTIGTAASSAGSAAAPRNADLERELKSLTHVLSLTKDQQSGVRSILVQHFQQIKALNQKPPAESLGPHVHESPQARASERQNILSESNQKIASLLDPTQKKTFSAWLQKHPGDLVRVQPVPAPYTYSPPPPQPAL